MLTIIKKSPDTFLKKYLITDRNYRLGDML